MNGPTVSVVLLASDSDLTKNNSVLAVVRSIADQDLPDFELVIVNNSSTSRPMEIEQISEIFHGRTATRRTLQVIQPVRPLSRGGGRNEGARTAQGSVLVFVDDDTAVVSRDALSKVRTFSQNAPFGCGAKRDWLPFEDQQRIVELAILADSDLFGQELARVGESPGTRARGSVKNDALDLSFIGNFGFVRTREFRAVNGFPDYEGYGFEDDCLMFRLYQKFGPMHNIGELKVLHFDHPIHEDAMSNVYRYFNELRSSGAYWFHATKLFEQQRFGRHRSPIEPLEVIHFDHEVLEAYNDYCDLGPLHLATSSPLLERWRQRKRLGLVTFTRTVSLLLGSETLESFVQSSESDLDSVAPIVEVAVNNSLIELGADGTIVPLKSFKFSQVQREKDKNEQIVVPRAELNQFPCDDQSRARRLQLLREKFPFCEHLRFALIGDDDLLSVEAADEEWLELVVIEADEGVGRIVDGFANPRTEVLQHDVRSTESPATQSVYSFLADPPYTRDGVLAFVSTGLELMEPRMRWDAEFFVVLSPSLLGKDLYSLFECMASYGIILRQTVSSFSSYELPKDFDETRRAEEFYHSLNMSVDPVTSSSSNLYNFVVRDVLDARQLRREVVSTRIYDHLG